MVKIMFMQICFASKSYKLLDCGKIIHETCGGVVVTTLSRIGGVCGHGARIKVVVNKAYALSLRVGECIHGTCKIYQ